MILKPLVPIPKYITFIDWACVVISRLVKDNLPSPYPYEKWEDWAEIACECHTFKKAQVPQPRKINISEAELESAFTNWEEWAMIVYMNLLVITDKIRK